jgi:4-amino-4-deoxy-L-arabinose transferase-like glycosyltransferase/tetratricopeptide (TPR) repeat protein
LNAIARPPSSPLFSGAYIDLLIAGLIFVGVWTLLIYTSEDVGLVFDEFYYFPQADLIRDWLAELSGPPATPLITWLNPARISRIWQEHPEFPPLCLYLGAFSRYFFQRLLPPLMSYRLGHMGLFALLVAGIYLFAGRYYGRVCGLFSALALLSMPRIFGQAQVLELDLTLACLNFFCLAAFVRAIEQPQSLSASLGFGVSLGLALLTKINAFFIPLPLLLWGIYFVRPAVKKLEFTGLESRQGQLVLNYQDVSLRRPFLFLQWFFRRPWQFALERKKLLLITLLAAPALFFLLWPWLWHNTAERLNFYFRFHLKHELVALYYWGNIYLDEPGPWHYPWVMTLITTPVAYLVLAALGGVKAFRKNQERSPLGILLVLATLFPILIVMSPNIPKYDGCRLFLSAFPFLAILAGIGLGQAGDWTTAWIGRWIRHQTSRAWLQRNTRRLLFSAALLEGVAGVVLYHPYELSSYYNPLIGGLAGAVEQGFEASTWNEPVNRDLIAYLNETLPAQAAIDDAAVAARSLMTARRLKLLRDDISLCSPARYMVLVFEQGYFQDRFWWDLFKEKNPGYELLQSFEISGTALVKVFEKNDAAGAARQAYEYGRSLEDSNENYRAIEAYRQAICLFGQDSRFQEALILAYGKIGDFSTALSLLQPLPLSDTNRLAILNDLGQMALENRALDQARKIFGVALRFFPKDSMLHNNLCVIYLEQDKPGAAQIECQKALQADPHYWPARINLALTWKRQDKIDLALNEMRKVLEDDPENERAQALFEEMTRSGP